MAWAVNRFVVTAILFAGLGAFITGQIYGTMNGILEMEGFKDTFRYLYNGTTDSASGMIMGSDSSNLNASMSDSGSGLGGVCSTGNGTGSDILIGLIVSILSLGAVVGALTAGWLSDRISRKHTLSLSGVVVMVGAAFISTSFNIWLLLIGRFLVGVAIGLIYMVMPVYISELSPKEHRGMLTSTIGPAFNFGVLFGLSSNIGFEKFLLGWRVTVVLIALLGLVYAVGMLFQPHTPRWLVKRGRDKEALAVLTGINKHDSNETFVDTCLQLKELQATTTADQSYSMLFKELFHWKCRVLLTGSLFTLTTCTGLFIYFYSSTFFCKAGIRPFYASLVLGVVVTAASILSTFIVDKVGRKTLFLGFIPLLFAVGLALAVLVQLNLRSEVVGYIVVILICLYAFGYSATWLTLPWVVNSEIFPINIRGITVALTSGLFWFSSFVINQLTPLIVGSPLQLHGFFYIITGFNLVGFLLILFGLPETKGVSLEEVNTLFSQSIWQRFVGYIRCTPRRGVSVNPQGKELEEVDLYTDIKCEVNGLSQL